MQRIPAPAGALIIRTGAGFCACGCLERVAEGRTFRPGHDARLKGKLIRAGRQLRPVFNETYAWEPVGVLVVDGQEIIASDDLPEGWEDGDPAPVFDYNSQHLNCTWTAYEYGYHCLSERGASALWRAIENPTYRRGSN
jgi:hypothetical protein